MHTRLFGIRMQMAGTTRMVIHMRRNHFTLAVLDMSGETIQCGGSKSNRLQLAIGEKE